MDKNHDGRNDCLCKVLLKKQYFISFVFIYNCHDFLQFFGQTEKVTEDDMVPSVALKYKTRIEAEQVTTLDSFLI